MDRDELEFLLASTPISAVVISFLTPAANFHLCDDAGVSFQFLTEQLRKSFVMRLMVIEQINVFQIMRLSLRAI